MMIEQHYDEEVLAEFLAEPADAVSRDQHLATCGLCQRTLDSLRTTAQVLTKPAVWDTTPISTTPRPETLAFLRGLQKSMLDEDAQAALWIKQLLAGPRETWAPRLEEHPEWRTGGMVRALLKAGDEATVVLPADSLEIARIASVVAEDLVSEQYPPTVVQHLRGLVHFDLAYSLWYTGAIVAALDSLDRCDDYLRGIAAAEFDRGRAQVMRALIYHLLERREDVLSAADVAAEILGR